jgi:hypothetical protein
MRHFISGVPNKAAWKRLTLGADNAKLKKLLAEQMMDVSTPK